MTEITIRDDAFLIDGRPTYAGRRWRDYHIEGLLLNTRMVQATFDDANPDTRGEWAYPDTGGWHPNRNTDEFIAMLPVYRQHGVLAVTLNMQGGNPQGYRGDQPWINNGYTPHGDLRRDYVTRLARLLDVLDANGMVAILGAFYFGQDQHLMDEQAVARALDNLVHWVLEKGYRHVLIEVNNECDVSKYVHEVLMPERVHELISRVRGTEVGGRRLLVGTSFRGRSIPREDVVRVSDFLLLHGNGESDPDRIAEMVERTRAVPGYRPMPILFNEDDHYDFDQPRNNMVAAVSRYASWGFLECGQNDYVHGYQSPPVNWGLNTEIKRGFFGLVAEMTGASPTD